MAPLSHVSIVLVNTEYPENIGSVARAMKNMGLKELVLINPVPYKRLETYALAHRYQTAGILMKTFDEGTDRGFWLDVVDWVENSGHLSDPADAAELMDVLVKNLYAVDITSERYNYFLYTVLLENVSEDQDYARGVWRTEWNSYVSSGDDFAVRIRLERLLSDLIETPEFQLY